MEWWVGLIIIFGTLIVVMVSSLPVAFAFLTINLIGAYVFWGGTAGLGQLAFYAADSVSRFSFLTVLMFVLMGELLFHSGIGVNVMDAVDKWVGRLPGRLGLVAIGSGTLFSALSGSAIATAAMMGSVLTPEMEKRGYKKPMSIGTVIGGGALAMIIPPSSIAVVLASMGEFSIARLLVAGIVPGVLIAILSAGYIVIRCSLQPWIAPSYPVAKVPLTEKISFTAKYVAPMGIVIFLVLGLLFLGIATASEAAAMGALGALLLIVMYRQLNREVLKKSFLGTLQVTIMVLMIVAGAKAFSQLLVFSGVSRGLVQFATGLDLPPALIIVVMLATVLFLGCFMDLMSIIMITMPIFMPIIFALDINPVWFGLMMLIALDMGNLSPPFGFLLFVMKGASPETPMADIIKAAVPFLLIDVTVIALVGLFPMLALWLPSLVS